MGSSELLSTDTVKGRKNWGQRELKRKKRGRGKQISTNLSLGADLETDGHNEGGGNIPGAYTTQPY